jgi:hypothetical protein
VKRAALTSFDGHDSYNAFGINPWAGKGACDFNCGREALGQFGKLDRWPACKPIAWVTITDFMIQSFIAVTVPLPYLDLFERRPAPASSGCHDHLPQWGIANHNLTAAVSGNISTAISLLVSAPPRSTRIATHDQTSFINGG